MLQGSILSSELSLIKQRRTAAQAESRRRLDELLQASPALKAARERLIEASRAAALCAITHEPAPDTDALEADYDRLLCEHLAALGLPADYLAPHYECAICGDTGMTDDGWCSCLLTRVLSRMSLSSGLDAAATFEAFDLSIFPDEPGVTRSGLSQRAHMQRIMGHARAWADSLPDAPTSNVVIYGSTGLGKTYLMNCIGNRATALGTTTLLTTAWHIVSAARSGFDMAANIELYMSVPLLLIDDLGMEPMLRGVTVETVFTLLSERQAYGRRTVISTNLTSSDIRQRYGERLLSRLADTQRTMNLPLYGRDVRYTAR